MRPIPRINHEFAGTSDESPLVSQLRSTKYNLKDAVKLPEQEDPDEWIANNIYNFYKQICMLYGTISEHCTAQSCPIMKAGDMFEFWSSLPDQQSIKQCAPEYIENLLDWVKEQLDDEEIFPSKSPDKGFPTDFRKICESIARKLLRVYAHVCHHHATIIKELNVGPHMNTSLKHFVFFVREFHLVSEKDLECLKDHIREITRNQTITE